MDPGKSRNMPLQELLASLRPSPRHFSPVSGYPSFVQAPSLLDPLRRESVGSRRLRLEADVGDVPGRVPVSRCDRESRIPGSSRIIPAYPGLKLLIDLTVRAPGDRRLIVNAREAETVRSIFRRYCELGSVRALRRRLLADGVTSKRRVRHDGHVTGGHPLHRGALYYLLRNRLYRGAIVHQDTSYPGQHEAIVDAALWDQVQASLAAHTNGPRRAGPRQPSLLTGLVVDAEGEGLTPSHAVKSGRRYRYYVSRHLITEGQRPDRIGWRLPAADLERLVVARLRAWLGTAAAVTALLEGDPRDAAASATLITHATRLATHWPRLAPAAATTYLHACIRRVVIRPDRLTLEIDGAQALETLLASPERVPLKTPRRDHAPSGRPITLDIPAVLTRAGLSMRLVVPGARPDTHADPCLIRLLWRAFTIHDRLTQPPALTLPQIAAAEQVSASYVTRLLRLRYLAPDIVAAIVEGRQPAALTATTLMHDTRLPVAWAAQRARLGLFHKSVPHTNRCTVWGRGRSARQW